MRISSILFCLLIAATSFAQQIIEPCKFGQPLIDALQLDYTPSTPLGYGPARDILYSEIDNVGLELSGIYTNFTITLDPAEDPSVSAFDAGINAEHVYPQSLGASSEPMKSDLHNIFPSKVNVNEVRGNCQYREVDDSDTDNWFYLDMQSSSIPSSNIENYSEKDQEDCYFEPREAVKGDIARAMFYFYSIYQSVADNEDPNYLSAQQNTLYQWHILDPVDAVEWRRDSLIALEQGNRNPFILDSTLVQRAFFEADASYPEGDPNCFSLNTSVDDLEKEDWVKINATLVNDVVRLSTIKNIGTIHLYNLQGQLIYSQNLQPDTRIETDSLPQGIYILQVQSRELFKTFKFFKA